MGAEADLGGGIPVLGLVEVPPDPNHCVTSQWKGTLGTLCVSGLSMRARTAFPVPLFSCGKLSSSGNSGTGLQVLYLSRDNGERLREDLKPCGFTLLTKSLQITTGPGENRQVSPSPYCTAAAIYGSPELCSSKKCPRKHFLMESLSSIF